MSKYTEAIEVLKRNKPTSDPRECGRELCNAVDVAIEALAIADRLEYAITDEQTADCIIVDVECVNSKHDKEVWLNGYNQALVDIRGDNTGNN